jgi:hypothetical protein
VFDLTQIIPLALGTVSLVAIASDSHAPCGTQAKRQAESITDHLRALANHARDVVELIVHKTGTAGDN